MAQQLLITEPMVEGMKPFPNKTYRVIYADPPWKYSDNKLNRGGAEKHYKTQSDDWIQSLPVSQIADDNSLLFLWVTAPKLKEGLMTLEAWGFDYITTAFVWAKKNKVKDSFFMGMGAYTRANAEFVLLGKRGNGCKIINHRVSQLCTSKIRQHSEKPPAIRNRIVQLVGDVPRIELFARQSVEGWEPWGNEVPEV